jgi:hypothetical protein
MTLAIVVEPAPLRLNEDGVIIHPMETNQL